MDIGSLANPLISGAAGRNIAGTMLKQRSLGPVGNSIVGMPGGGIGGQLLGMPGAGGAGSAAHAGGLDIGLIVTTLAGGGESGAILRAVAGAIRQQMGRSS